MEELINKQSQYEIGGIKFSSNFESGNLSRVVQKENSTFCLWIEADPGSSYRTWFYFWVEGISSGTCVTFIIMNMSNQVKLFKEGHLPVFKQGEGRWGRIKIAIQQNGIVKNQQGYELTFKHTFMNKNRHSFAFSYPWSVAENNQLIRQLIQSKRSQIYANYTKLCHSSQGGQVKLLTITRLKQKVQFLNVPFQQLHQELQILGFKQKKGIFVSARVHPGEVASSHILNGFMKWLFSNTVDANLLLDKCVIYIVPIVNPDGVIQGNFRTDSLGRNLNRFYTNPCSKEQPQIFGIKSFLIKMIKYGHICFCLDLHAHVNKQGAFVYGNNTGDLMKQVDVCLFPKLLQYNCRFFDFDACNFSQKNMSSKDKADQMSKQGAARVAIYKQTGLVACWTLQCNYNSSKTINIKAEPYESEGYYKSVSNGIIMQKIGPLRRDECMFLNVGEFEEIGENIAQTILDYYGWRIFSRCYNSKLKNINNIKLNLAVLSLRSIPFKFDNQCRKILTKINNNTQISESLSKIMVILGLQENIIKNKSVKERESSQQKSTKANSLKFIGEKKIISQGRILIKNSGAQIVKVQIQKFNDINKSKGLPPRKK